MRDEQDFDALLRKVKSELSPVLPELAAAALESWRNRQFTNTDLGEPWHDHDVPDPVGLDLVLHNAGIDVLENGEPSIVVFSRVSGAKTWFLNQKCGLMQRLSSGKIRIISTETRPGNWIADSLKHLGSL